MFSISPKNKVKGQQLLYQRIYHVLPFIVAIVIISACTSSPPPPIMTNEKFDVRKNEHDITEFVYGISWQHTSQESIIGAQPESIVEENRVQKQRTGRKKQPSDRQSFAVLANNQTKLELEDKAAEALQKKLTQQQICQTGYEISKVIWKADNIRLFGHCK